MVDIVTDKHPGFAELTRRVETERFGPFTFQIGVSAELIRLIERVDDAHELFKGSPLSHVADRLEKEVLVSSIHGTNSIEGGDLTEEETQRALELDPAEAKEEGERRVANIKAAYDIALAAATQKDWLLSVDFIKQVHAAITSGLQSVEQRNEPGAPRWNPDNAIIEVGSKETGGRYRPPQFGRDVRTLLEALVQWQNELAEAHVPALIRAPLLHLYFELIHPFWDGNGRVGRVLEATVLRSAGYRYAPFALAKYYLDEIREYFALFNHSRREAEKKHPMPNTKFVEFHLKGMLQTIKRLHQLVNRLVNMLLFETTVRALADSKEINTRQYAIVMHILKSGAPVPMDEIRHAPWYVTLYLKRGDKTKQRDMMRLRTKGLLKQDKKSRLWPGFLEPDRAD